MRRTGAKTPLVVGDRLDTDIEGANRVGVPSLLVLTGVATPAELVCAPAALRPTYIARDLRDGLLDAAPAGRTDGDGAGVRRLDGERTRRARGASRGRATRVDALRALCAGVWSPAEDALDDSVDAASRAARR